MVDLIKIQLERDEWVKYNFPNAVPEQSVLGVIEEVGELTHHFLKKKQSIRGTDEEHLAGMRDSVGDALVYLLGVCSGGGFSLQEAVDRGKQINCVNETRAIFLTANRVGRMATDGWQFPHLARRHVGEVYWALASFCSHMSWDIQEVLQETWNQVKKRDWISNPTDGNTGTQSIQEAANDLRPTLAEDIEQ